MTGRPVLVGDRLTFYALTGTPFVFTGAYVAAQRERGAGFADTTWSMRQTLPGEEYGLCTSRDRTFTIYLNADGSAVFLDTVLCVPANTPGGSGGSQGGIWTANDDVTVATQMHSGPPPFTIETHFWALFDSELTNSFFTCVR